MLIYSNLVLNPVRGVYELPSGKIAQLTHIEVLNKLPIRVLIAKHVAKYFQQYEGYCMPEESFNIHEGTS